MLALGDNQYQTGTFNEYFSYYDRWWGKVRTITEPVPGDHEYNGNPNSHAHGYFAYWGASAEGHDGFGYRSFDLPHNCTPGTDVCWHIVALNSELCLLPGGCGPAEKGTTLGAGNEMYRWLKHDLATHPNDAYGCTLGFWHHPLFSFSQGSGATPEVEPLWALLYASGADVVLNSNSHNYQRWEPQDPAGQPDPPRGIREFVIGTGGVKKTRSPQTCGRPVSLPPRTPRSASSRSNCRQRDSPGSGCRLSSAGVQRHPNGTGGVSLMSGDGRVGTEIAGHRVASVIGRGGMSVVYLAEHLRLRRRVALKILGPSSPKMRRSGNGSSANRASPPVSTIPTS